MSQIINNNGTVGEQINMFTDNELEAITNKSNIKEFSVSKIDESIETTLPDVGNVSDSGYDIFVAELSQIIIDKILEINKKLELYINNENEIQFRNKLDGKLVLQYIKDQKLYKINGYLMLPTGIQFLFPNNIYGRICNRSSNSKYNINIIEATIDNQHSNNCCFQIAKLDPNDVIIFNAGDRIAQLILATYIKPNIKHLSTKEFNDNNFVKENRLVRSGNGIGSTGK